MRADQEERRSMKRKERSRSPQREVKGHRDRRDRSRSPRRRVVLKGEREKVQDKGRERGI